LLIALAAIVALFTVLWLVSLVLKNASIVDIWWGLGFVLMTGIYWMTTVGYAPRRGLVAAFVVLWGARLAWHIGSRNIGHGEDFRYAAWRRQYGPIWWWRSYLQVFLLQAVIGWIVALPVAFAMRAATPAALTAVDWAGIVLFTIGFLFEAIGDWQMRAFKADSANKGRLMDRGLWRYTRHPNYFGESVLWWGLGLMGAATPGGVAGLIGPALITFLLLRVSGVTMLEATLRSTKPGYADYVARTSAFVPWRPRVRLQ